MEKVKLEHINKETKLEFVVEYLKTVINTDYPDTDLPAYELGKGLGRIEVLRMLEARIKDKDK